MAEQDTSHSGAGRPLSTLDSLLGHTWPEAPAELRPLLERLYQLRSTLRDGERRITVFGVFKTGKSSLINALAGAPILPVRTPEGTRTVVEIRYAEGFRARLEGVDTAEIAAPDVPARLMEEDGAAIMIEAPLPLLDRLWGIVDTPGLFRSAAMTERAMSRLERTDLAILVLAADQILSAYERAAALQIDRLLLGNLIYVVNRIDTVDPEEREAVLAWARHALKGSGNGLTGRPCVVPASARPGHLEGIDELHARLLDLCTTETGERIATLSRLGRLQAAVAELAAALAEAAERREAELAQVRAGWSRALEQERAGIRTRIGQGRRRLQGEREALPALADGFVRQCVEATWRALRQAPRGVRQGLELDEALSWYAEQVNERIRGVALDLPVTVSPWDLSTWLVRANIEAASHPTTEVGMALGDLLTRVMDGGQTGREMGKTVGGWLGRTVFGVDVEEETRKRVERGARQVIPPLQAEAEAYISTVDALLADAERYYGQWTHLAPGVAELEHEVDACRQLGTWSEELARVIRELITEWGAS